MGDDVACAVSGCLVLFGDFGNVGVPTIFDTECPSSYHPVPVYSPRTTFYDLATSTHSWIR